MAGEFNALQLRQLIAMARRLGFWDDVEKFEEDLASLEKE